MGEIDFVLGNSTFPEPIGGVVETYDLVPNILFCLGFAVAFAWNVFNYIFKPNKRGLRITSTIIALERMLVTCMRIAASLKMNVRESWGLTEYQQATLSLGFIGIAQEQVYFILCTAVLATRDGIQWAEWEALAEKDPYIKEKRKDEREKYRRWKSRLDWTFAIAQTAQGAAASVTWSAGVSNAREWFLNLRLASNLLSFLLMSALLSMLHYLKDTEAINPKATRRLRISATLLVLITIFRSSVSRRTATTLSGCPLSALPAKIAFYIFQLLPELAVISITAFTDYRNLSDTGMWGDYPRNRIERGLPPRPPLLMFLRIVFVPWKWQRVLYTWIVQRRERKAQSRAQVNSLFYDTTREMSFISLSRRQSTADLGTIIPPRADIEKQSVRSMPISNHSKAWPSFGNSGNNLSSDGLGAPPTPSTPPLITDVNLWRPRLPLGFSSR